MPQTISRTVYSFDELDERAKERARDWFRQGNLDYEWWDMSYDDFIQCGKIIGIEIGRERPNNPKASGRTQIYFSGFSSQGDGASWKGDYCYAPGASKNIREHAPNDERLHAIADGLQELQRKYFYNLRARVGKHGRYAHEMTMDIDVSDYRTGNDIDLNDAEGVKDLLRDFARWIYRTLEQEHDYLQSDEQVDDSIRANEYTFDESGHIA